MSNPTETLLQLFFETSTNLIVLADTNQVIVDVNAAFLGQFGFDKRDITGQKTAVLFAESGVGENDIFDAPGFFKEGEAGHVSFPTAYRKKSGDTFIGMTDFDAIRDQTNTVTGYILMIRAGAATAEREEFLKTITNLTSDASKPVHKRIEALIHTTQDHLGMAATVLVVCDELSGLMPNGRVVARANPSCFHPDVSDEDLIAICLSGIVSDEAQANTEQSSGPFAPHLCGEESLKIGTHTFGALYFLSASPGSDACCDHIPDIAKILGSTIASQLKFAQQNRFLELEEARFRELYRRTPAIMHSIDRDGLITEVSDEWLKLLDYERRDVIGQPSSSFLTEESRAYAVSTALPEFWAKGSVSRVAYTMLTRNQLPVEVELSGLLRDDGTSLAVMVDVTERNAAQRALQQKNNALQAANEEFRQFAFVASHDLQEPLRKIRSFCDLLEEAIAENNAEDIEYSMSVVRDSAERSSRLISDLLALSKAGHRGLPETRFDLREALRETLESLSPLFTAQNATTFLDFDNEQVTGDRTSFLQMMHHMLGNAAQYSRSETNPHVRVWTGKSSSEHTLNIEDNGIGINPKYHESIFEPFKRLHARTDYEGTGIGLAICRAIADRHGWKISVSEKQNPGTVFTLHMPT